MGLLGTELLGCNTVEIHLLLSQWHADVAAGGKWLAGIEDTAQVPGAATELCALGGWSRLRAFLHRSVYHGSGQNLEVPVDRGDTHAWKKKESLRRCFMVK